MEQFAQACNQILVAAQLHKCYNATKLHHLTYKLVREATALKANHVCQAIRRVLGNLKTTQKIRKFRPTSVSLDARTFVYHANSEEVGVTLIDKRHTFKLLIGNYQRALLSGQSPTSATLVKRQDGSFYINIAIELDTPPTGKTPKVVGVDLGRRDIATTSTGKVWNGTQLQQTRDRYSKGRANVREQTHSE
jgi:transposase